MVLWCAWGISISAHAALVWRQQGDQRENLCWMLVLVCTAGVFMFGYLIERRSV